MTFSCIPLFSKKAGKTIVKTQTLERDFPVPGSDLLIIDCGSRVCRAGFSGENSQRVSIPTIVGRPKKGAAVGYRTEKDAYVGQEAREKRFVLNLSSPIERGVIQNWDDMEICFDYIIKEGVQINPLNFSVLLTESLNNPTKNREKLLELMMEKFHFKSFFLAPSPPLALYAYGFHTGVVLESGEGQTHIVPVYQGMPMFYSAQYIPLGGQDINNMLENILSRSGETQELLESTVDKEFLRDIKEKYCYVAYDYEDEFFKHLKTQSYRLPNFKYLELRTELFRCTEPLFDPKMLDVKTGGIHENIYRAIHLSDPSIRNLLNSHIVLSGGNTMFPGLQDRLLKELRLMSEPTADIRVHANSNRKDAIFLGASLLSSLSKFKDMMITHEEYLENGPSLVNRKCF